MSNLINKALAMKNMTEDELREYIKTLSDNDKNTLLFSFVKTFLTESEVERINIIE